MDLCEWVLTTIFGPILSGGNYPMADNRSQVDVVDPPVNGRVASVEPSVTEGHSSEAKALSRLGPIATVQNPPLVGLRLRSFILIVASTLFLAGPVTIAQTGGDEDLMDLALLKFKDFGSAGEEKAFETFLKKTADGQKVDLTPQFEIGTDPYDVKILTDPTYADLWGKARTIKAEWIVWLCTDPKASAKVTSRGIEIDGARIDGIVDLAWAKIQFPLRMFNCDFSRTLILDRCSLRSLQLQGSHIEGSPDDIRTALAGEGLTVEKDILLTDGFQADGRVWLQEAAIGGSMDCGGGQFNNPNEIALNLENAKTGPIYLNRPNELKTGFIAKGEVRLRGATIDGTLDCNGGQFFNFGKNALDASSIKVEGSVFLGKGLVTDGTMLFLAANIGNVFELGSDDPKENAVFKEGTLDLRDAKAGTLLNGQQSSPKEDHLSLHGFVFNLIDNRAPLSADSQLQWLRLHSGRQVEAQPYEQMAAVLRSMGLQEDAVKVMIAKNEELGQHPRGIEEYLWFRFFGPFIGFGYTPWNAFYVSIVIILLGYCLFKTGERFQIVTPTKSDDYDRHRELYPKFNAFIYSLETFVPFVKLGLDEYWMPNANCGQELRLLRSKKIANAGPPSTPEVTNLPTLKVGSLLRCYYWFHIIAGWVLTTLWVGGLTGLLKT
jgi:hypothetical protein